MRFGLEILNIEVGLAKAVEKHEGISASVVETLGHVDHGAEEGRQLDRNRNPQTPSYLPGKFAIAILDVTAVFVRVGLNRVEIELDSVSAGLLHLTGVANPPAGSRSVQTGDDGNSDSLFCLMNQLQVAFRPCVVGLQ